MSRETTKFEVLCGALLFCFTIANGISVILYLLKMNLTAGLLDNLKRANLLEWYVVPHNSSVFKLRSHKADIFKIFYIR